jgi:hypothetical protein
MDLSPNIAETRRKPKTRPGLALDIFHDRENNFTFKLIIAIKFYRLDIAECPRRGPYIITKVGPGSRHHSVRF